LGTGISFTCPQEIFCFGVLLPLALDAYETLRINLGEEVDANESLSVIFSEAHLC